MHQLSDAALLEELRRMEGTPDSVLADPELLALILPTIRADLTVVETAEPDEAIPFPAPITAFGGEEDRVTRQDLAGWQQHTHGRFMLRTYPGGHFFLHTARDDMLGIMESGLSLLPPTTEQASYDPQAADYLAGNFRDARSVIRNSGTGTSGRLPRPASRE